MPFLPRDFEPPTLLQTDRFRIRPITIHDVINDYDAVMTVDPPSKEGYDAEVAWWAREDGLEDELGETVRRWLASEWPLERVAYPGREIPWHAYEALPDR